MKRIATILLIAVITLPSFALAQKRNTVQGAMSITTTTIIKQEKEKPEKEKKEKPEKEKKEIPSKSYNGKFQQSVEIEFGALGCINLGASYIAGYRFNNAVFVGGGVGFGYIASIARLFANAKFYLTKTRVKPFFDISVGGAIGYRELPYHDDIYYTGVLLNPQFGINIIATKKIDVDISFGVNYLPIHENVFPQLRAGISF